MVFTSEGKTETVVFVCLYLDECSAAIFNHTCLNPMFQSDLYNMSRSVFSISIFTKCFEPLFRVRVFLGEVFFDF